MTGLTKDSRLEVESIVQKNFELLKKDFDQKFGHMQKDQDLKWGETIKFRESIDKKIDDLNNAMIRSEALKTIRQAFISFFLMLPGAILAVIAIIKMI